MSKKTGLNDKRNYIRRKKYLQDCTLQIKAAIDFITIIKGNKINNIDSEKQAILYAQQIEAVCWSPRSQMSAENYQKLMQTKTREFTSTILKKALPFLDILQLQKIISALIREHEHNQSSPTINLELLNTLNLKSSFLSLNALNSVSSQSNKNISQMKIETNFSSNNNCDQATSNQPNLPKANHRKENDKVFDSLCFNNCHQYEKEKQMESKHLRNTSAPIRFPISASDSMSVFEFGDGSPNNPYFISNLDYESSIEEKNELYPILLESDEITNSSTLLSSPFSLDASESMTETDSFFNALIL